MTKSLTNAVQCYSSFYFYLHLYTRLNPLINQLLEIMSYKIARSTLALTIIVITFAPSCDGQITGRTEFVQSVIIMHVILDCSINPR